MPAAERRPTGSSTTTLSAANERVRREPEDLREALVTAMTCRIEEGERWKVTGIDTAGDELMVVVMIEAGVVVVTLF